MNNTKQKARARFSLDRIYRLATLAEVWALWTTKDGIESWWGPEGFEVKVESLDLRVGGELRYLMIAVSPEHVEYMKRSGMQVSTPCKVTFTEIRPLERLTYSTLTDFIPDLDPYEVETTVDIKLVDGGVKMTMSFDAMHDDVWTARRMEGCESQLRKLDQLLKQMGVVQQ